MIQFESEQSSLHKSLSSVARGITPNHWRPEITWARGVINSMLALGWGGGLPPVKSRTVSLHLQQIIDSIPFVRTAQNDQPYLTC